jgi:hypothetical protein
VRSLLNDIESKVLWDTGAQVYILSREMMEKFFDKIAINNISELIDGEINWTAANGTKISYSGWAEIEVRLSSSSEDEPSVIVPFLITNDSLEYPILGYSVIEELVKPVGVIDKKSVNISSVEASFQEFNKDTLLELLKLIQEDKTDKS